MKKYILLALVLTGCGRDFIYVEPPTSSGPTKTAIELLVEEENAYRVSIGQSPITRGIKCTVQRVSGGQWISSSSPGYNAGQGVIATTGTTYTFVRYDSFNRTATNDYSKNTILPEQLRSVITYNHIVKCSGFLVVLNSDYYSFDLDSDDGSILTIGGTQVVNNDGNHGMTLKSGARHLRKGIHSISLNYAQTGNGLYGFILKMNGEVLPGEHLYF